jgi:hypothetical protein
MVEFTATSIVITALFFIVGLLISAIIIFAVTRLSGEKEGFGTALLAGLVGAIIYAIAYFLLGQGLLAAILGGFFWLLALRRLYKMSWLKSLGVAIIVWIMALIVGIFLPTSVGPL